MLLLYVLLTISVLNTNTATRLVCLYCTDAVSPTDCDTVINCGPHESCYVDSYVRASGSIRYNLGCRDEIQCNGLPNSGRRELRITSYHPPEVDAMLNTDKALARAFSDNSPNYVLKSHDVSKRTNGLLICSECCKGNLCSNAGCGNKGYISTRGPICYNCAQQINPEDCYKIRLCSPGEVCMLLKTLNPMSNEVRYTTRCEREKSCNDEIIHYQQLAGLLIGKREKKNSLETGGSCIVQCCQTDMCNINCNSTYSSTTMATSPTVPVSKPTAPTSFCIYKSKTYNQGDVWQDGCRYNCTCEDAKIGFYRCQDLCPVWNNLPSGCTLEKKPGECCSHPNCGGTTLQPGLIANTCYSGGKYYHEGEQWKDGCKYKCTCQDGKTGRWDCQSLCLQWNLPPSCHLDPPPADKCCQVPVCPSNVQLQYPPGFVQE
ncbi:cysteine-rich motor neuron 1 protein-like [Mercenaria mercenaria]|uniref:cysteine-rich motor neuron 1 protein-like n=1 Tax=Mercenaria mercenaria TaxID=6596 RepID=UPI00234F4BA8|nr:cysteine-rich motor neuron 1 protein-like [Mercenaria mercenaria]XP_053402496.1 cysteine-rich motor neuron 1 protein-like [Mercenaria mercenaria]